MNNSGFQDLLNTNILEGDFVVTNLILPNLDPNSVPYIDSTNTVQDIVLSNGQLVIGTTAGPPVGASLTGSTDMITVTNGPGTITLTLPQQIATTSSPTFTNITINGNVGGPVNTRSSDNIISCSTAQITGDLVRFSASSKVIEDAGLLSTNIVTNTGIGAVGNIPKFVSDKIIQDSNIAASNLFLADGTVNATGNFNLNSHELQNVSALRPNSSNIIIGTSASAIVGSNIVIGNSSSISNSGPCVVVGNSNTLQSNCNNSVLVGDSVTLTAIGGMQDSVFVGSNITSQGGTRNIIVGKGSSNDTGNDNVIVGELSSITAGGISNTVIGAASTMSGNGGVSVGYGNTVGGSSMTVGVGNTCTATRAHSFGLGVSNSVANSFLIDARTNVRVAVDNLTDLGTSSVYWKDGYFKGSLIGGTNSRTCDNIVSTAGSGITSGHLASFTSSDKIIQDSGIASSSVTTGGPYLLLAGGMMVGTINMNSNTITNGGVITVTNSTNSTSAVTGSIISSGGIGLAKDIFATGAITSGGIIKTTLVTDSSAINTGSLQTAGGFSCVKRATIGDEIRVLSTNSASTSSNGSFNTLGGLSTTKNIICGQTLNVLSTSDSIGINTGSIQTVGGLSTIKSAYIGDILRVLNSTSSTTSSDGSFNTVGGLSTVKNIICGDTLSVLSSTDSSSVSTGSCQVLGGLGVAKKAYIGDSVFVNSTSSTAKIVVAGGVQNVANEDTCIRAISSSNSTKLELQNTGGGRIYEIRSGNNGTYDVTDRTGNATRFSIDSSGNFGFNGTSFGGGGGVLFIANVSSAGVATPSGGGLLFVQSGILKYRGSSGTTSNIAPA